MATNRYYRVQSRYILTGSGGSSGPDINDLGWITTDVTDGTWTQSDPAGVLLSSVAVASEVTRVNVNAVGASSADNNFSSSPNFTGPRWYKALTSADGTRITSDDTFVLSVEIVQEASASQDAVEIGLGYCVDPTATTTNGIQKVGGSLHYRNTTGNPSMSAMLTAGRASSTLTAGQKIGLSTTTAAGTRQGAASYISLNTSNVRVTDGANNVNQTMSSGTDLFLVVLVGLFGNSTTLANPADIQAKLRYRLIKFEDPPT